MKEEIITFETAKLAKEKGFKPDVSNCIYDDNGILHNPIQQMDLLKQQKTIQDYFVVIKSFPNAPTQSVLAKWLRELHNTDITVITDWKKGKRVYYIGLSYINNDNEIDIYFSKDDKGIKIEYTKYELALEEGLKVALNLI